MANRLRAFDSVQTATTDLSAAITAATLEAVGVATSRDNHIGQDNVQVLVKTGAYTIEGAYLTEPTIILGNSGSTFTISIPEEADAPCKVGTIFKVVQLGTGAVTVAPISGTVVLLSPAAVTTAARYSVIVCEKIGTDLWIASQNAVGTPTGTPPTPVTDPTWNTLPTITYAATTAGSVMTCVPGTTDVTTVQTFAWRYYDNVSTGGPFSGFMFPEQITDEYTTNNGDIGSQMICRVTATPTTGQPLVYDALGPVITAAAPAPPPPPPPTSTTRGPLIASFTVSSPITATSGQTIEGLEFSGSGIQITVPLGVQNVLIRNCKFTSTTASAIQVQGTGTVIRNCAFGVGASFRGILLNTATNTTIQYNTFGDFTLGTQFEGHAIENDYNIGPTLIDSNDFIGTGYNSDVVSNFQVSRVTLTNNYFDVQIDEPSGAAFTMGDGTTNTNRGRDNYIARNTIQQTNGVPAGVFGSDGNTIIEFNCFTQGIQAYAYPNENPGPFLGVTIRKNVINIGASYVPVTSVISEWGTNIDSTNCALVPAS